MFTIRDKYRQWPVTTLAIMAVLLTVSLGLTVSVAGRVLSSSVSIHIQQHPPFFSPHSVSAEAGSVIRWENRGGEPHSILADNCLRRSKCAFESQMLEPGEHYVLPELEPGDYAYHCGIHPFMRGFIRVTGKRWGEPSRSI